MKTNKEIKKLFEESHKGYVQMFEINIKDYIESIDEDIYTYTYYNYNQETNMLELGSVANIGFLRSNDGIEYSKDESFDENINSLLEYYIELTIEEYKNNPENF